MRTAVYNRYWSTGGGAEKYGGVIAQVLSGDGPLDLLSHDPVDVDWLADRLHLELSKVDVRLIDDEPGAVTEAADDYDLFVNVSYMSSDSAAHRRSLYVVHFPSPVDGHMGGFRKALARTFPRLQAPGAGMRWGKGFYHREPGRGSVAWTNGDAHLQFTTEPGQPLTLLLAFAHRRPPEVGPTPVRIEVDGRVQAELTLAPPRSRLEGHRPVVARVEIESPAPGVPVDVRIVSDTFVPAEVSGSTDRRRLGVPLKSLHVGAGRLASVSRWLPILLPPPASLEWVETYGAIVSNSEFTRHWVERWWECDSQVVYPPVTMHEGGAKEPVILSVGRFFAADMGHSKKQLELVRAFRKLYEQGVRGWTLHLVGGCSDDGRSYFDQVQREAAGYPVELHPNASGQELEDLYRRASIYWHASGLGEDPERHPGRLEHFGITTAEAMSAGAVPVVIGLAGQLETVRHGVDGFHFQTLDGLCALTRRLIDDEALRRQMSASSAARARTFSIEAFERRLRAVIDGLPAR
ncbi:MAG TPA: glycosyltransferase family 4 protein [Acidimicrobiales bacterium]